MLLGQEGNRVRWPNTLLTLALPTGGHLVVGPKDFATCKIWRILKGSESELERPRRGHGSWNHNADPGLSHVCTHPNSKDPGTVPTESDMPNKCADAGEREAGEVCRIRGYFELLRDVGP